MHRHASTLLVATAVLLLLLGGCGHEPDTPVVGNRAEARPEAPARRGEQPGGELTGGGAPDRRMTEEEIPPQAVASAQAGSSSAESFAGLMESIHAEYEDMFPEPTPADVPGLLSKVGVVARGTITKVELVPSEIRLGPLAGAQIHLRITLDPSDVVKASRGADPTTWVLGAWMGDPVMARLMLRKLTTELGKGPVGAEALLYGNPSGGVVEGSPGNIDGAPLGTGIYDGLVEDASGTARVSVLANPGPQDLTSIDAAMAAMAPR